MASIEFIKTRIAGAEKRLEKLNKKMDRIRIAKESDYEENNPYCYSDYDFRSTEIEINRTREALAEYGDRLRKETEKAASRNVKAINDFLDKWLSDCVAWFEAEYLKYQEAEKEHCRRRDEFRDRFNSRRQTPEERRADREAWSKEAAEFKRTWTHVTQFDHGSLPWHETMLKDLEAERIRKYDDIIERTNEIIGQITNAAGLEISPDGNLNGIIEGTKGRANVHTIGAGGYNIQCFHFRTLIHKI